MAPWRKIWTRVPPPANPLKCIVRGERGGGDVHAAVHIHLKGGKINDICTQAVDK